MFRVPAVLRGMDVVTGCIVEAWVERSSFGRTYIRCNVIEHPSDLPDGTYQLALAGHTVVLKRWHGKWDLNFLPPEINFGVQESSDPADSPRLA